MRYSDLPPKGTKVQIIWQDSGAYKSPGVSCPAGEMNIGTDELFGRIVRTSKRHNEITIAHRKPPRLMKLDPTNDFYMTVKIDSIVKLYVLEAVAEFV